MNTYKELFSYYEDKEAHQEIQEVTELEIELRDIYKEIKKYLNAETMEKLDVLIGRISRAYEMQGFDFAQRVFQIKSAEERIRAEEIQARLDAIERERQNNSISENGLPCRLVTYNGVTKKIGDWIKMLGCGTGTFYNHFRRGGEDFDKFMTQRLADLNL